MNYINEPEFLSLDLMMKAVPLQEGTSRYIYCEASDESKDLQNEVVLQKALCESMEYFLMRGNLDLDHITLTGAKAGIPDFLSYEIGQPIEVKLHGGKTLVKGEIYSGTGPMCEKANLFWSSLTDIKPPAKWSASVGGAVQGSELEIDPVTQQQTRKITKVRWSNLGFSRQPVNQSVNAVSTVPMAIFAKSWAIDGCYKTLTAGYGTDAATLTGGGALRKQSLFGYPQYREAISGLILNGVISTKNIVVESIARYGISQEQAVSWAKQLFNDLQKR
jgi:hypothetical protein